MISKTENCEYSFMIADLMVSLDLLEEQSKKYILYINYGESVLVWSEEWDLQFLQEGIKATKGNWTFYALYDLMELIRVEEIK